MQKLVTETGVDYFAGGGRPPSALALTYIRGVELPKDVAISGRVNLEVRSDLMSEAAS